jgi:hypothetical protein
VTLIEYPLKIYLGYHLKLNGYSTEKVAVAKPIETAIFP